jgi:uncharacterized protein YqfA (UPF0365 family)
VVAAIILLVIGAIIFSLIGAWVKALFNGAAVPMSKLVALKLASIPYSLIVDARITAVRAGIDVSADQIASHFQAGGNVVPTVQALIAAQKAGIGLPWDRACAIDLATKGSGKSVVEAVRTSVDPKVIDCPNPESGRTTIDGEGTRYGAHSSRPLRRRCEGRDDHRTRGRRYCYNDWFG